MSEVPLIPGDVVQLVRRPSAFPGIVVPVPEDLINKKWATAPGVIWVVWDDYPVWCDTGDVRRVGDPPGDDVIIPPSWIRKHP